MQAHTPEPKCSSPDFNPLSTFYVGKNKNSEVQLNSALLEDGPHMVLKKKGEILSMSR